MSYAAAAEGAAAFETAIKRAGAEESALRAAEALKDFADLLRGARGKAAAAKMIEEAVAGVYRQSAVGVSLQEVHELLQDVIAIAEASGAKKSVLNAYKALGELAAAHGAADAEAVLESLRQAAARAAAAEALKAEKKLEKERLDRRKGAIYAERFAEAPRTRAGLTPILAEMLNAKPKLGPEAWKEVANRWLHNDSRWTGKTAKAAVETHVAALISAAHTHEVVDRAIASGF